VEPFIDTGLPFIFSMLAGALESLRHILTFKGKSSELMYVLNVD
jgi:hypothetical protein